MSKYIMRLDDACEKRNTDNWDRMEQLLDKYGVKPLVGVIPDCQDPMMKDYPVDNDFWNRVHKWEEKGWTIAMHGYQHLYTTKCGGINPINSRSEFAGETLDTQRTKIKNGVAIMREHGIDPQIFFAPSHTFDENTITALKEESNIRVISDTIANKPYTAYGITFVPQQSGRVRKLPFHTVTFCYHPNSMLENDFAILEKFLKNNKIDRFDDNDVKRKYGLIDVIVRGLYFLRRKNRV